MNILCWSLVLFVTYIRTYLAVDVFFLPLAPTGLLVPPLPTREASLLRGSDLLAPPFSGSSPSSTSLIPSPLDSAPPSSSSSPPTNTQVGQTYVQQYYSIYRSIAVTYIQIDWYYIIHMDSIRTI